MSANTQQTDATDNLEHRDRLLRRTIAAFVIASIISYGMAVGMSVLHESAEGETAVSLARSGY